MSARATRPLTVRVTLTLTVDPDAWRDTYGLADDEDVRADVRSYVASHVHGSAAVDEGSITAVAVR